MADYITRRRRRWYCVLDIPVKLRPHFGKRRFIRTLGTDSKAVALRRAPVLIAAWQAQIAEARGGVAYNDAEYWRLQLQAARSAGERRHVLNQIELAAEAPVTVSHAAQVEPPDLPGAQAAAQERERVFVERATGQRVRLEDQVDDWVNESDLADRTKVVAAREVRRFAEHYPEVGDVNRKQVQAWANVQTQNLAVASIRKKLSHLRSYWRYLRRHDLAPDTQPFDGIDLPRKKAAARDAFTDDDLKYLLKRSEGALHDLIAICAFTGLRIDEACQLRAKDVDELSIRVRGGKTPNAAREVPVHSELRPYIARLLKEAQDKYLLPGHLDRYGYRSNALGQAFSTLKRNLGFGKEHTFHSLRHGMAVRLENAGVPYNVISHIMGWRDPSMLGTYGHGISLEMKAKAVEKALGGLLERP